MTIEVFMCPQCGGNLEDVYRSGYYTCPYCRARMRINVFDPDPNTRPDGRRTIYDRDTGGELCYIKLPRGWLAEGSIENRLQSANWPFCIRVRANAPDRSALIRYQSGASFKEVVTSSVERHNEGGFDQAEMMPMMRLRNASEYADAFMAIDVPQGTALQLIDTRPLPKIPPEDEEAKRRQVFEETASVLRAKTPPGMRSGVDQAFYNGITRVYSFPENGIEMRQAVATVVSGVKISFGAPMMFFGRMSSSVFWDALFVLTLRAPAEFFESNYENLVMFCSSMQSAPAVATRMIDERNRILGYLESRQRSEFEAHQRRMQEQQASYDAYNQAWLAKADSEHKARRANYAAQQSSDSSIYDKLSEANRGVDTYIRPDGTEVEYSVVNEAAFANANDSRNTFATQSKAFESVDWVEMKKKY